MKKTQRDGEKWERFFYEELKEVLPDLKPTTNSGATFGSGDLTTKELYLDVKSTIGEGLPKISRKDWAKAKRQAEEHGKDFCFPVVGKDRTPAVILPLDLAKRALRALYEPKELPDLYTAADDETATLDQLRLKSGQIWDCPGRWGGERCGWYNPRSAGTCERCGAPRILADIERDLGAAAS